MKPTIASIFTWAMLATLALLLIPAAPSAEPAPAKPAPAVSLIVQGRSLDTAAEAVRAVGGEITHRLGIIRAVAARIDPARRDRLAAAPGVARIYDDRTLHASSSTSTFRDELNAVSWSGSDGTGSWGTGWIDDDPQDPDPVAGTITVVGVSECPSAGINPYCVFFQANKGHSLSREVNLTGAASATLSYAYAHEPLGGQATAAIEVSSDGGQSWTTLKT